MGKAGAARDGHRRAHRLEVRGARLDARPGHVRVGIARREERGGAGEIPGDVEARLRRADAAADEGGERAVAARVARHVLGRQTGALGKADQRDPLGRDPRALDPRDQIADRAERRVEPGLVRRERRQEGERIPAATCRLGREEGETGRRELAGELEHAGRGGAAAVEQDRRRACRRERRAGGRHAAAAVEAVARRGGRAHAGSGSATGASGGSCAAISARCGSSQGGSTRLSPRCPGASSTAKPGPSVASSNSTPPGSRK